MAVPSGISLKTIYFFYFGSLGSLLPFLSILFNERGISPTEIGTIMMVLPACNLVIPPFWGILADTTGSRLLILRLALIGSAGCVFLLIPHYSFWVTFGVMVCFGIFRSPLTSLLDAITHAHLGNHLEQFGRYRLWGSLGFLISAGLFGHLRDTLGETRALLSTSALIFTCALSAMSLNRTHTQADASDHVWKETLGYLRQPSMRLFIAGVAVYYLAHSFFDVYMGLHLKALGYSDSFVGTAWAVGVAVEVGLMVVAPQIFQRFSTSTILCFSALAATLRWSLLSVVTSKAGILAQQPLHALTFGLWYLACAKWIQSRSPPHLRASLQSVMISSMGLGMVVGYPLGGWCYDSYGGSILYMGAAGVSLVAFVLYLPLRHHEPA